MVALHQLLELESLQALLAVEVAVFTPLLTMGKVVVLAVVVAQMATLLVVLELQVKVMLAVMA
jgi:hypothetical protein